MSDNVERQLAAERRGWVFEVLAREGPPAEGQPCLAAQATLLHADHGRGQQCVGEGDDPLANLLDKIEQFELTLSP